MELVISQSLILIREGTRNVLVYKFQYLLQSKLYELLYKFFLLFLFFVLKTLYNHAYLKKEGNKQASYFFLPFFFVEQPIRTSIRLVIPNLILPRG